VTLPGRREHLGEHLLCRARPQGAKRAPEDPEKVEPYRMYWIFVVAVWPLLYVLVYLV
jgi:heme/copper-type cytochrome/quinol oxidase subunit 3